MTPHSEQLVILDEEVWEKAVAYTMKNYAERYEEAIDTMILEPMNAWFVYQETDDGDAFWRSWETFLNLDAPIAGRKK